MDDTPVYDKLGQKITPGCFIAYGHALGRCAGLRVGIVLAVKKKKSFRTESSCRITVQGADDDWNHEPRLCKCKGTLMFPNRIIVLHKDMVPYKFQKLFKDFQQQPTEKCLCPNLLAGDRDFDCPLHGR